jgi:N-acetylneuraminic acid mutarotase
MNTETWDTLTSLPSGTGRQYAVAFSFQNTGFIFGGISGNTFFNDLLKYDVALNSWTFVTPIPAAARMGSASFVLNGIAYIIGGRTASALSINEVWAYDILNDSWQQKNDLPFGARWRSASTLHNNKGYIALGRDENDRFCNELFEYDELSDSWNQISTFPLAGRTYSSMLSFNNDLFLMTGLDSIGNNYNDLWRINTDSLIWQQLSTIPGNGRRGGICFNDNQSIYYSTGVTQNGTRLRETWKITEPTSVNETLPEHKIDSYPNPANTSFFIELPGNNTSSIIEIIDNTGRVFKTFNFDQNTITIKSDQFPDGFYSIRIFLKDKWWYSKIIIQH